VREIFMAGEDGECVGESQEVRERLVNPIFEKESEDG